MALTEDDDVVFLPLIRGQELVERSVRELPFQE